MLFIHPLSPNSGRSHFSIPPVVVYITERRRTPTFTDVSQRVSISDFVSLPIYIYIFFFGIIIFNIFGLCSSFPIIREERSPPRKHSSRDLYVRHAAAEQHRYVYKCVSECVYRRHKSSVKEERERERLVALFYLYETTSGSLNQSKAFGRGILSTLRVMLA